MNSGTYTALNTARCEIALGVLRAIRRGMIVATTALDYYASEQDPIAWEALHLAQAQYQTALQALLLSEDLTPGEWDMCQAKLQMLRDILNEVNLALQHVEPGMERGRFVANSDILRREVVATGQRLSNALKLEQAFRELPDSAAQLVVNEWKEARRLIETAQHDYDAALTRYQEAVLGGPNQPDTPLSDTTILLLEDERTVAAYLKKALHRRGAKVLRASTGEEAVKLCEIHGGGIDIIIADVILSGGARGLEVAAQLGRYSPDLPVLFISGHPREELANQGLLDPDSPLFRKTDFLQKPFSCASLERTVRRLAQR